MAEPILVLASGSPRRAALLARLGLRPQIRPPDIDERPLDGEHPSAVVARLAASKARAVHRAGAGEVVLAADTVVVLDGQLLGKPVDDGAATGMLQRLSGRTHEVLTAVAVHTDAACHRATETTRVRFRRLTAEEVHWYLDTGEPRDKAGAYGLQGAGAALVEGVDGSDTNVIGLPLSTTVGLLRAAGLDVLRPDPGSGTVHPAGS
ncbi:MAG: Maf family protein [Nitriliruptoraceae bacterium]